MVLCCLLNRGDSLLCDEYTYSHLVEAMVGPKGYVAVPVPMDDYGMTPESLEQVKRPNSPTCCHMCSAVVADKGIRYVNDRTKTS